MYTPHLFLGFVDDWLSGLEVILCKDDKCKSGRHIDFLAPDRRDTPSSSPPDRRRRKVEVDYRLVVISV